MVPNFDTDIEILLFDQEKLVTYKELNTRFDITPKEAHEVLESFIERKRKEDQKKKFHVTYLIICQDLESKAKKIQLVNENDLKSIENEFKIISKQVYSIQNRKIDDFNFFYSNDIDSSTNIDRKSNLKIVYNETVGKNQYESIESSTNQVKNEPDMSKLNLNKASEAKKPVAIETSKVLKPTNDYRQKENIKDSKIKDEPMDTGNSETVVKKPKMTPEKEVTSKAPASKAPTKKEAAKPSGKQATLTSFFKKA